ncbi:MAG TPA: hypothetical protein VFX30_05485 [bacterium]|nr:hypothetical protein [bacterium]
MTMTKTFFQIAAVVFLIAGAYGCQGLTTPGSGFQGGTEAGNPPTDGGFIGGTEAGNPPTGETTGGPGGGSEDPREGGHYCDKPDTPEKEGSFPCPQIGDEQRLEMPTPEQMGMLHEHQDQQKPDGGDIILNNLDSDTRKKLNGALGDFGHSESVDSDDDEKVMIKVPPNSTRVLNPYDPKP